MKRRVDQMKGCLFVESVSQGITVLQDVQISDKVYLPVMEPVIMSGDCPESKLQVTASQTADAYSTVLNPEKCSGDPSAVRVSTREKRALRYLDYCVRK